MERATFKESSHLGCISGVRIAEEDTETLRGPFGRRSQHETEDVTTVLVGEAVRLLGPISDLMQLGDDQRCDTGDLDSDTSSVALDQGVNLFYRVIDQRSFQATARRAARRPCSPPSRAPRRPPGGATASGTIKSTGMTTSSARSASDTRVSQIPGSG